ncbi:MAG: hypothetical protein U5K53_08250 [Halanaerobiales bacterium]|nr:hypothetical protein [Halanaerobiales bacterium]
MKQQTQKILFGFDYHNRFDSNDLQYFSYNLYKNKNGVNIKDYDYLFHISNNIREIQSAENNLTIKVNELNDEITIFTDNNELYQKSLIPLIIEFHQQNKENSYEELNQDNFIFIEENNNIKVKMIFNSIYGSIEEIDNQDLDIRSIDFYLLIDLKNK